MVTDDQIYKAILNDTIFEAVEAFYDQIEDDRVAKNSDGEIDIDDELLATLTDISYKDTLEFGFETSICNAIDIVMSTFSVPYMCNIENQCTYENVRNKMKSYILDLIMEHHGIGGEWKKWN